MAQLTDDCFAFAGPLLPVAEMERLIATRIQPVAGIEEVGLRAAPGRVLARDVVAGLDLPPFDNSAVDGFAVRHRDLAAAAETRLAIRPIRVTAGAAAARPLGAGAAVRIFTGAPMPAGADTVFMQEDCRLDGDAVVLPAGLKPGANRRRAGEDIRQGALALPAGRRLATRDVALAAAIGMTTLAVRRRVRVALFSTGDEVVEPGAARGPSAIYDANRYLLAGLLEKFGADLTDLGILADDPDILRPALAAAADGHDLVITSGGVSTGEADHVRAAVEAIGRLVFWRVAIKPGRPVAMGVIPGASPGTGAAFAGLPGNPAAVFVTFVRVVRPLLLRLAGAAAPALMPFPVRAAFAYRKKNRAAPNMSGSRAAHRRRRRDRGHLIRTGRRRRDHVANRDLRPRRAFRGCDDRRAGRDSGLPVICGALGIKRIQVTRSPSRPASQRHRSPSLLEMTGAVADGRRASRALKPEASSVDPSSVVPSRTRTVACWAATRGRLRQREGQDGTCFRWLSTVSKDQLGHSCRFRTERPLRSRVTAAEGWKIWSNGCGCATTNA